MVSAPEATSEEVQLPVTDLRGAAKAAARAEVERPEATDEGTATAEPTEPTEESAPEPEGETPTPEGYLTKAEVDRLLARQKQSFKQEIEQARSINETQALLAELDELRETDPDAYAERLDKDARAAQAIASRSSAVAPELLTRAKIELATEQAALLGSVRPDIMTLAEDPGSEAWQDAFNPEKGGVFGYIQRTALAEGEKQGVENFKKSPEFKKLLEEAERRGAHNALGGIETPPPQEDGGVPAAQERKYDDPRQAAVAAANRAMGRMMVDPSRVGRKRR